MELFNGLPQTFIDVISEYGILAILVFVFLNMFEKHRNQQQDSNTILLEQLVETFKKDGGAQYNSALLLQSLNSHNMTVMQEFSSIKKDFSNLSKTIEGCASEKIDVISCYNVIMNLHRRVEKLMSLIIRFADPTNVNNSVVNKLIKEGFITKDQVKEVIGDFIFDVQDEGTSILLNTDTDVHKKIEQSKTHLMDLGNDITQFTENTPIEFDITPES